MQGMQVKTTKMYAIVAPYSIYLVCLSTLG